MGSGVQPVFAWVALGTNQGNRIQNLVDARVFLESISESAVTASSIYETEPLGPADKPFLNAVIRIQTFETPEKLLEKLKSYEKEYGRDVYAPRWSNRIIDLDIIEMENVQIQLDWLQIPHKEYSRRLFVLVPFHEIQPDWHHSLSKQSLERLMEEAPKSQIIKTEFNWN
ncbi:2-amino-4-hydroxy-6-hydroxymethyldihydropteridine diphosphokinase [bacterium]|nr:MAG: 2-amino-4-hydroxy-6-hydroxymethyldihydropteridine diphosphokinase [bacterium]